MLRVLKTDTFKKSINDKSPVMFVLATVYVTNVTKVKNACIIISILRSKFINLQ